MKGTIASLLVLACVTACADVSTTGPQRTLAPGTGPDAAVFLGNPPPPPMSADSYASTDFGTFEFHATYFFNKPGNNGWISLDNQQPAGVTVSPNARIEYHQGQVSGKGTLSFATASGGVVTIDLSRGLSDKTTTFNDSCGESGCASVGYTGVYSNKGTSRAVSGVLSIGGEAPIPITTRGN